MSEELKPCPFCGGTAARSHYDTFGCRSCAIWMPSGKESDWNRRTASTIPASEAGELPPLSPDTLTAGDCMARWLYGLSQSEAMPESWRTTCEELAQAWKGTASATRTAAGEAECDAALGRVAPAGQHGAGASAWTDREIDVFTWQVHPDCRATARSLRELVRAVEAKLASRGAAQGRITQPESFAVELGRESIAARTQADAGKAPTTTKPENP